jgi:hypothetical protein
VIDEEFAQRVQEAIGNLTGQLHNTIFVRETPAREYYKAYSGNQELCEWLQRVTCDKRIIPDVMVDAMPVLKKEFIAGLMDGDGWICVSEKDSRATQFHLGYACTDPWIHDMVDMLNGLGVTTGKVIRQNNGGVRPLYRFELNKRDFVKQGCTSRYRGRPKG